MQVVLTNLVAVITDVLLKTIVLVMVTVNGMMVKLLVESRIMILMQQKGHHHAGTIMALRVLVKIYATTTETG